MPARLALALVVASAIAWLSACHRDPSPPEPPAALPQHARTPPRASPPAPSRRPATLSHVTIKALGMYCEESCPLKVRTALADVPAVYELGFDLTHESIFVSYDTTLGPAKQVTRPMLAAIRAQGFDPWLARESWPEHVDAQVIRHAPR